jgi:gamma-glutamylcyclotransferase (GGCT)/AIG2-like uncharacterized protein YtfP
VKANAHEISWYFAYGSNMNPARMRARGIDFKNLMTGRLEGYELRFNKRATGKQNVAYANIAYCPNRCVEGVLYQLERADDIALMDPFEGNPVRYSREVYRIHSAQGLINAWVYVANRAMLAQGLLPERQYLNHLIAGGNYHSEAYNQWLQNHPCIDTDVSFALSGSVDGLKYNV